MGDLRYSGALAVMSVLTMALAGPAIAQTAPASSSSAKPAAPAKGSTRGVRIIKPEAPAPAPQPAPPAAPVQAVAPKPKPAPGKAVAPIAVAPVIKACPRPFARPDLVLGQTSRFDRTLKSRLAARRGRVVVDLATPYAMNADAPAEITPWLNEVKASGGIVSMTQYCQMGRGGLGNFFKNLFGGAPKNPYKAARTYDAVLHADALDQRVTQIEFTPRAGLQ